MWVEHSRIILSWSFSSRESVGTILHPSTNHVLCSVPVPQNLFLPKLLLLSINPPTTCNFTAQFFVDCYIPLGEVMDMMALLNCTFNFLLYCLMSRQFRCKFMLQLILLLFLLLHILLLSSAQRARLVRIWQDG